MSPNHVSTLTDVLHCALCGRDMPRSHAVHGQMIHGGVLELIRNRHPDWVPRSLLCTDCVRRFGTDYVQEILEQHRGELSVLDKEVVESLREHEIVSLNVNSQFDRILTLGERLADRVATIGGSWAFLSGFALVLIGWIALNSTELARAHFDPYPYILLNLVLSCLAAVQAPVIMMSQNRRESKDHLQTKIDQLLSRQWQRLFEIQQIQTDILEDLASRSRSSRT